MDINIRFSADDRLLSELHYFGGWACNLYKLLKQQPPTGIPFAGMPILEPEDQKALDEMVGKVLNDAKEKPATASSASPVAVPKTDAKTSAEPAKETAPAKPDIDPNAKVDGPDLENLRKAVMEFGKADTKGENRNKLGAWLKEHGLRKVPDATNAQAAELLAYIKKEEGAHA